MAEVPPTMRVSTQSLIEALEFGYGVAEKERNLGRFFLQTAQFRQVLESSTQLILGVKGSGKTAIAQILKNPPPDLGAMTNIVPLSLLAAQEPELSSLPVTASEEAVRDIWEKFIVSTLAERFLYPFNSGDTLEISPRPVANFGITLPPRVSDSQFHSMVDRINSHDAEPLWMNSGAQVGPLIEAINTLLENRNQECWLILDQLDDAFDPSIEVTAMRALVRAIINFTRRSDRVHFKLFLRSDFYQMLLSEGNFRSLSHLPSVRLSWDRRTIGALLAQRIRASVGAALAIASQEDVDKVVSRVLPNKITPGFEQRWTEETTLDWCIAETSGRQGEPSPRNLIGLLGGAKQIALSQNPDEEDAGQPPRTPLLRGSDLLDALPRLSETRLWDTLLAENAHLQPYVLSLVRGSATFSAQHLHASILETNPDCEPGLVIRDLEASGLLHHDSARRLTIAPLYRPALKIGPRYSNRDGARSSESAFTDSGAPRTRREAAKQLSAQRMFDQAIGILVDSPEAITEDNATLAVNIAIQSSQRHLIAKVSDILPQLNYFPGMRGRDIALKFALGKADEALSIALSIQSGAELDTYLGQFVGSIQNDPEFELAVWNSLSRGPGSETMHPSPWEMAMPVWAAARVLPIARAKNPSATGSAFQVRVVDVFRRIYYDRSSVPTKALANFLQLVADDYSGAPYDIRPYAVVSIARTLRLSSPTEAPVVPAALRAIAQRVAASEVEFRDAFNQWAERDDYAKMTLAFIASAHHP